MPQFVHVGASCIARDPSSGCATRPECRWVVRLVSGRSDFSVKRHCSFERNQRRMLPDVLCEPFVQCASLFFENPRSDCDSSSSQPFETFAAHRRIGIVHASDNTLNSRSNQRVGAWAGAAYVRAGFEVNVESCATRPFACLLESQNFRVLYSFISVKTLAHNCAATIHNDCANTGIGRSQPNALPRKIQSATKKCFIGLTLGSHELCIISPQESIEHGVANIRRRSTPISAGNSRQGPPHHLALRELRRRPALSVHVCGQQARVRKGHQPIRSAGWAMVGSDGKTNAGVAIAIPRRQKRTTMEGEQTSFSNLWQSSVIPLLSGYLVHRFTQTVNPQNPLHQTAAGLRVFLRRRHNGPGHPIRARWQLLPRLWPSRPA